MAEPGSYELSAKDLEIERKPKTLWRAFTVDPRELTIESLHRPLTPGTSMQEDPHRLGEGNEIGVYMSTNRNMVEAAYAHTSKGLLLSSPRHNDNGSTVEGVTLPQCGIVVEVDTKDLPIRNPKITPALQGHYNNGFEGDELIANVIPPENYRVVRLVLSRFANDNQKLTVDIPDKNPETIQTAIDKIKIEFAKREQSAKEYVSFLETLNPNQRLDSYILKRKWAQTQSQTQNS